MSSDASPTSPRSIALPIFALAIAAVILATAVYFAVTFDGPPPKAPPRGMESIAYALKTFQQPSDPGPPLQIESRTTAPLPFRQHFDPAAAKQLSRLLGAAPADVIAYTGRQPGDLDHAYFGDFTFGWRHDRHWRVIEGAPPPFFSRWHAVTLLAMVSVILLLTLPAWWIARAITRPLRALAAAADRAGTGAPLDQLPGGSREVRDLSRAVSTMHARLAAHADGRTAMLAAIAHDLGTPLSRIAFWIEGLSEEARTRASADIDEMRGMIAASLAFARDDAQPGQNAKLDLGSLIESLSDDMAVADADVSTASGGRAVVRGDPPALRRLFANLIGNAVRYGERARIDWQINGASVVVRIADDGSGIADGQAERLFQPFVRGDPSRNRATGGTGLGLAIARSIATRHGGAVTLANAPGGGAVARVVLPLAD